MTAQARKESWGDMQEERLNEKLGRKMISGEKLMLSQIRLEQGCVVPKHSHHNEQMSFILEGAIRFWLGEDEEEVVVREGEVLVLPSHLPHSAEAIENCLSLDVFSPPRQDWLDGTDDYLRRGRG